MNLQSLSILVMAVGWTVAYVDSIRVGLRDRSYAMPFWALALNITWESVYALHGYAADGVTGQVAANFVWACLDFGILFTYFRYGRAESPFPDDRRAFVAWSVTALLCSLLVQYVFIATFGLLFASIYTAFGSNLMMSVMFVELHRKRGSNLGQSKTIGYSKWLGTLAVTLYFGVLFRAEVANYPSTFIVGTGLLSAAYDLYYLVLLHRADRASAVP